MLNVYTIETDNGVATVVSTKSYFEMLNDFVDFFGNQKKIILLNSEKVYEADDPQSYENYLNGLEILRKSSKFSLTPQNFLIFNKHNDDNVKRREAIQRTGLR